MEKIFVADSYKEATLIGNPFTNEKGKQYIKAKIPCPRCGGSGHYSFNPLDGTTCFKCSGNGFIYEDIRAYTEKEYNTMKKSAEKAKEKRIAEKEAKIKDYIINADKYKHEIAIKYGFSDDNYAYTVYGGDTFEIKDKLKELGAHFNPVLKWFFSSPIENLPEGYKLCKISFDEIYDYIPATRWTSLKENAEDVVSQKIKKLEGPSTSIFYPATIKDKIKSLTVKVDNIRGFSGAYGYTYIYTFTLDNYVFVWMTTKEYPEIQKNDIVNLSGTIKDFSEYNGINQTQLTRCSIEKEVK